MINSGPTKNSEWSPRHILNVQAQRWNAALSIRRHYKIIHTYTGVAYVLKSRRGVVLRVWGFYFTTFLLELVRVKIRLYLKGDDMSKLTL